MTLRIAAIVFFLVGALSRTANAELTREQMLAQSLFEEGRALMQKGDYASACPKLSESQALDPGGGTLLNLAVCHEQAGKLGTAYLQFHAALSQAVRDGRKDREEIATSHLRTLSERVPKLSIHVVTELPSLEIFLDETPVRKPAWDVPTVVDPGEHTVTARAPGTTPITMRVVLNEGDKKTATVELLQVASDPAPPKPSALTKPVQRKRNPMHILSAIAGIAGYSVASISGVVWTLSAIERTGKCNDARAYCTPDGLDAADRQRTAYWIGAGSLLIGTAGLLGLALIPETLEVRPEAHGGSLLLRGRF